MFSSELLHLRQCYARLNDKGLILRVNIQHAIQAREIEDDAGRVFDHGAAADQSGVAALGNQCDFG